MSHTALLRTLAACLSAVALVGCDYSGDFLFPGAVDGVPGIYQLLDPDTSDTYITPVVIESIGALADNTIYAEVGPPDSASTGGVTFEFQGTGRDVCVWVDPESIFWGQAISPAAADESKKWSYPDNVFDDGDLDLDGGRSVFYTGGPEEIGDFKIAYEDALGNPVQVSLSDCVQADYFGLPDGHAGRGSPEYCTLAATELGIDYTIVMSSWSTPLDDDRLAFGLVVYDGNCDDLKQIADVNGINEECLVAGEAIDPANGGQLPARGYDPSRAWAGYSDFEDEYCSDKHNIFKFCEDEAAAVAAEGGVCDQNADGEVVSVGDASTPTHCFCGDPTDDPIPGAG